MTEERPITTNGGAEYVETDEESTIVPASTVSQNETTAEEIKDGDTAAQNTESAKKRGVFARLSAWFSEKKAFLKEAIKERAGELENAKKKRIIAGIAAAALVVFFVLFYLFVGIKIADFVKDLQGFKEWIEGFDEGSVAIFVGLRVIMTVFRVIPGGPLQFAGGCAFGTWGGLLWCMVGSAIGTLIIFFLGKRYGTKLVGLFVSPEKMRSAALLKDKKKRNVWLFMMNFLPGTPKDIFTWVAALADDGSVSSILVILLSRIPSVLASTWSGHELMQENYLVSGIIFGALLVISIVCSYFYKKISKKKEKAAEIVAKEETENGVGDGEKQA